MGPGVRRYRLSLLSVLALLAVSAASPLKANQAAEDLCGPPPDVPAVCTCSSRYFCEWVEREQLAPSEDVEPTSSAAADPYEPQNSPAAAAPAAADYEWLDGISVYAQGVREGDRASVEATLAAVGTVGLEIACPDDRTTKENQHARGARLLIQNPRGGLPDSAVLNRLFGAALTQVLRQCTMDDGHSGLLTHEVGFVELFGPMTPGARPELLMYARNFRPWPMSGWETVSTPEEERQRAAAQVAQAEANARAAAEQAELRRQQQEARRLANERASASFWGWVKALAAGAVLLWLFLNREPIARWYYFTFSPHPATDIIHYALATDVSSLDGGRLATLLGELPPDNSTLRGVRVQQAEQLYRELQNASARRARELEERARESAADSYERAAYVGIQEAVALAAVALERAKAAHRAAMGLRGR